MRYSVVLLALLITIGIPFFFQQKDEITGTADRTLVIISPHNEAIRREFTFAFREHWFAKTGENVGIDWRTPGGTSEIAKFLTSEYLAAFENYWRRTLNRPWNVTVQGAFDNRRITLPENPADDDEAQSARRAFLGSEVGGNIDLFFGGGAYDFIMQAEAGRLVDSGVVEKYPEIFNENVIPQELNGEVYWDAGGRWIGTCLSSFGICYNTDAIARLGMKRPPETWDDLGDPLLFGQVALADPTKSGSVAKAFEMLIQSKMQQAVAASGEGVDEEAAIAAGWDEAMRLIMRISANARYFTDSAGKIPLDVSLGDAAAGMSIDFYGRFQSEAVADETGASRLIYLTPEGGSSVGADPIGMLRGSKQPELAQAFIEFVVSLEGQKLWNFEPGVPGGPQRFALRRLPILPELYDPQYQPYRSDPDSHAYEEAALFVYHPEWTSALFGAIRFIVKVACLDPHDELKAAWSALIENDFPPEATALFFDVSDLDYATTGGVIRETLRSPDRIQEVRLAKEISDGLRDRFNKVVELAQAGK